MGDAAKILTRLAITRQRWERRPQGMAEPNKQLAVKNKNSDAKPDITGLPCSAASFSLLAAGSADAGTAAPPTPSKPEPARQR